MALIKCPECGNNISDKAKACIHCGFPLEELTKKEQNKPSEVVSDAQLDVFYNESDGKRIYIVQKVSETFDLDLKESKAIVDKYWDKRFPSKKLTYTKQSAIIQKPGRNVPHVFQGVYKYTITGERIEVYCPRCGSEHCSHYKQERVQQGKTKTRYTLNLNPLKPFTLVNKKEKQISQDKIIVEDKFICDDCGKIFK